MVSLLTLQLDLSDTLIYLQNLIVRKNNMAKARMLHKKISVSLQVDRLSLGAQLLFTWMIAAADDEGRMKGEPQSIKANVVPMKKWTFSKVKGYLMEMKNQGIIYYWEQNGEWIVEFPKWNDYQQIRKDRLEPSKLPSFNGKGDNQMTTKGQPDDNQVTAQSNISEYSSEEINKSEYSDNDLIADKNSPYKKEEPKVGSFTPTEGGNTKRGFIAWELLKRMEPGNLHAIGVYMKYAKEIPEHLLFQWASEIEQDKTTRNRGALFNSKAQDYLKNRSL